jgi:Patched family
MKAFITPLLINSLAFITDAFVTISIDFYFQITLFTAFMVIDENRIQAHRRDILCCLKTDDHPEVIAGKKAAGGYMDTSESRRDPSESKRDPTESRRDPSEHKMDFSERRSDNGSNVQRRRGSIKFEDMKIVTEYEAMEMRRSEIGKLEAAGQSRRSTLSRRHTSVARRISIFDEKALSTQIMKKYADILMMPPVKALVLLVFAGFFALCLWATTNLTQEFNLADYVPTDSYLKDVLYTFEDYASVIRPMAVYFRDIDQSDPVVQQQMINYVEDLEALDQISGSLAVNLTGVEGYENVTEIKPFCWVRDFKQLTTQFANDPQYAAIKDFPFNLQLQIALTDPIVRELYGQDIIIDKESGNITGSRCWMFLSDLDLNSIDAQLDMHHDQTGVTEVQPLNQHVDRWSMFFFDQLLFYWEAYDVAIRELIGTIASGVLSLAIITVVLIPHWTATFIVTPMIMMTYINYLGTENWKRVVCFCHWPANSVH